MTDSVETIRCTNCKRDILSSNFVIHDIHCQRNIYLCPKCNEPVNKSNKSQHEELSHSLVYCTSCHKKVEKYLLSDHLSNDCPLRKVKCQICEIEVRASDISEHENYCGARTEKCQECGEFVMLKYQQLHIDSNHTFIKLSDEPGPSPSWQNGRMTLGQFFPDMESIKQVTSSSSSSASHQKKKSHKSDSSKWRLKESPSFPVKVGDQMTMDFPDLNRRGRRSFTARESAPVGIPMEGHELKRRLSGGAGSSSKSKSHAESESVWRKGGLYQSERVTRDEFENSVLREAVRKGEKNSKTRPSGSATKLTRSSSSTSTSTSTAAAVAATTTSAASTPAEERTFNRRSNSVSCAEDSDLALALQINEELNGDFRPSVDQFVSRTMDETAAVLSRFNLFDEGTPGSNDEKRVTSSQSSRGATPSKSRFTCYADDSSDDEFLLYSKEPDEDFDDTALPCQFCGSVFPPHALMTHQKNCSLGLNGSDKYSRRRTTGGREKEALVPCGICLRLIPFSRYKTHQSLVHSGSTKK